LDQQHQATPVFQPKKMSHPNMPNSQKVIPNRIVIFAKDVMNITGRRERAARDLLQRIRENNGKGAKQFVTVSEFCNYSGLPEEEVKRFLI
jgi:hypothetical protein